VSRYLIGRLGQMLAVLVLTSMALFLLIRLLPGDPALVYAGENATDSVLAAIRREMGFDRPLPMQYAIWAGHVLGGDLGRSFASDYPVTGLLAQRLPATMALTAAALVLAVAVSIPMGTLAALRRGSPADYLVTGLTGLGLAVPTFWLGFMLVLIFAIILHWLPSSGTTGLLRPGAYFSHLVLPAVTLAVPQGCALARFVKSALLDILNRDYVRTAKAKGVPGVRLLLRHELRNALVSIATVIGLNIGRLLGGAVIIESVFAWPGVGRLLLEAILNRDYALVQGALLVFILLFMAVNLITDLLYAVIDPRIRLGGGAAV
jgi:peptide/nickel transport system permease protein